MNKRVKALVAKLAAATPESWTVTTGEGIYSFDGTPVPDRFLGASKGRFGFVHWTRTEGETTAVVVLNVEPCSRDSWARARAFEGLTVTGHTFVNGGCFTRAGIDVSSVELVSDPERRYSNHYGDVASMLAGEWDRCDAAVARRKTAKPVPGTPFTRQPEWFAEARTKLRGGHRVSLMPHGMGTGYTITTRKGRYGSTRVPELEAALGVSPLFVETFDAD